MIYTVTINNKEYEVEVEKGKANILKTAEVDVQNSPAPVTIASPVSVPVSVPVSAPVLPPIPTGCEVVKSPMPGTIINIKVSQGSHVKKGEVLLILEAMKMENEILAPSDGVVAQLFVSKGSAVSTGDNLISIQ